MPIYEFYSPDTNKIYSFYARSLAYAGKTPRCPDGAQYRMQKLISPFAIIGRAREPGTETEAVTDADDARFEAAMQTMEREFASMDIVFVDTAGRSQRNSMQIGELKACCERLGDCEVHLVLSST
ncbi:MAG: hypothetical protein N3A53_04900, partial [Verrucomicrobiae bacterium]|nr:hypothetical protein [Verrucomicrobiae bacterium]